MNIMQLVFTIALLITVTYIHSQNVYVAQTTDPGCMRTITEQQKKFVDSVFRNNKCFAYHDSLDNANGNNKVKPNRKNTWNGEDKTTMYKCRQKEFEGWFHAYKLMSGIQYIFNPAGELVSVKIYEEGKMVSEIRVPGGS